MIEIYANTKGSKQRSRKLQASVTYISSWQDYGNYNQRIHCRIFEQKELVECIPTWICKGSRSYLTNLLEAFEAWTRLLDKGHGIDIIFMDYRKAFDTVPHSRLLVKLVQLGITRKLLKWINNFISGRQMRVMLLDTFSKWITVLSGIPQGSVLGPLLFLIRDMAVEI